ncbi:MAG: MFS transporter [Promethearchaeota archaeon]
MILSKKSVVLILISVLTFGSHAMALIYYLPRYLLNLGFSNPIIQLITTIYPFSNIFLPQLLGKYSDKIKKRNLFFILGSIGLSLFYLLLMFTENLALIIIILILFTTCNASYRLIFTLYQELTINDPKYITYYNAITVAGWFLGSQFGGIFIDIYGVSHIFKFLFIISLFSLFVTVFIKENRDIILKHYNNEIIKNSNVIYLKNNEKDNPISKSIYFALFFRHFGVRPIITILAVLMAFHLSSDTQIGFLLGFNPLLQFFLMLITGKIITNRNQKYIMMAGFFLSIMALFVYTLAIDFWGFFIGQILVSCSYAFFWNAIQIYIAQRTNPSNKGKYVGYANSSFFSGGFFGGLFFTFLLFVNPDYYAFMWIQMIFPLLSTLSIFIKFKSEEFDEDKIP